VAVRRVENGVKERLLGARFTVRALVELGELDPSEVEVQVAYGRVDDADELPQVELATLKQHGPRTADGWMFEGEVPLATPGAFGYTVRVVPRHVGLATPSELGLVAWA
jgi:starch phosphorylase